MEIPDYSETLIEIKRLQQQAHEALLVGDKSAALGVSEELMFAARKLRLWIINQEPIP